MKRHGPKADVCGSLGVILRTGRHDSETTANLTHRGQHQVLGMCWSGTFQHPQSMSAVMPEAACDCVPWDSRNSLPLKASQDTARSFFQVRMCSAAHVLGPHSVLRRFACPGLVPNNAQRPGTGHRLKPLPAKWAEQNNTHADSSRRQATGRRTLAAATSTLRTLRWCLAVNFSSLKHTSRHRQATSLMPAVLHVGTGSI
jgi:hypothetical protein